MLEHFYNTIAASSTAEFKDRGSRFLAFAFCVETVDEFKAHRARLKQEHTKANHHCFAYRLGVDGNHFRVSDDGEPAGSAGRPILGQLDSRQVTNTLIIVVRYFGGTLLGVPGLINAYKTAAALAIEQTAILQQPILQHYRLQFDYLLLNEVMRLLKQYHCRVTRQELQLFCLVEVGIPKHAAGALIPVLQGMHGLTLAAL